MSPAAKSFLQRWFVTTLGVLAAANLVNGVHADNLVALLGASLLLGIFNAVLRPVLMLLSFPLLLLTLGFFTLVINAVLLYFVSDLVKGFHVLDFWSAFKGGVVISIVSITANMIFGKKQLRVKTTTSSSPPPKRPKIDTGDGPVIDV
jgi:putative membrane protein